MKLNVIKKWYLIVICFIGLSQNFIDCIDSWEEVERKAQYAVVQVWSQIAKFNWLEPFKAPDFLEAAGTAFFISPDGDLLTNFHVIDQAKSIFINIPYLGRRPLSVEIIGVCPETDVALMRLTKESYEIIQKEFGEIPYLPLGDSDILYRTEPVMALGYPLGQRYLKATIGVIGGREYIFGSSFMHVTSPINPGNSGGPSLNSQGEVVGINTGLIRDTQNMGYIVAINDVKILLDDLYNVSLYKKPQLGIRLNHATDEHTNILNNPVPGGAYVNIVLEGYVGQKSGIQVGDMLYQIVCKNRVYDIDEYGDVTVHWRSSDKVTLGELLNRLELGSELLLTLYRNGERKDVRCTFDPPPKNPIRQIFPDFEPEEIDYEMVGGAIIMQLRENHFNLLPPTSLLKQYSRYDHQMKEVLVITSILPGSQMHKVECFYPGALLDKVNDKEIKNLNDLRHALMLSKQTKRVAITTKDNFSTVLSLEKILDDERRLSRDFMYKITPSMDRLLKEVKIG